MWEGVEREERRKEGQKRAKREAESKGWERKLPKCIPFTIITLPLHGFSDLNLLNHKV